MKAVTATGQTAGQKKRLFDRLRELPAGTLIPAASVVEWLDGETQEPAMDTHLAPAETLPPSHENWRVLLWTAPAECRIGREELLEALGRPRSWLYRRTSQKADHRIPHRKLNGELVFVVGEVRTWLREVEEIVQAAPLDTALPLRTIRRAE